MLNDLMRDLSTTVDLIRTYDPKSRTTERGANDVRQDDVGPRTRQTSRGTNGTDEKAFLVESWKGRHCQHTRSGPATWFVGVEKHCGYRQRTPQVGRPSHDDGTTNRGRSSPSQYRDNVGRNRRNC